MKILGGVNNSQGTNKENKNKSEDTTTTQNETWGIKSRKENRALRAKDNVSQPVSQAW